MATAGKHFLKGYMEYSLHLYLQEHTNWRSSRELTAVQVCIGSLSLINYSVIQKMSSCCFLKVSNATVATSFS